MAGFDHACVRECPVSVPKLINTFFCDRCISRGALIFFAKHHGKH